ncbi:MAG: hypothetical protein F4Z16_06435 [Rhodothermaceae bacterium]|nr:hypothetical protein [Rhodothermaceae bacterium]MYD66879.1 hypothetical protein [Rhodothermaceae bacterium]MYJ06447.1 hypothetical protein [Rhodothermaceae bacterium]
MTKFKSDASGGLRKRSTHKHPDQASVVAGLTKEETKRLAVNLPVSTHRKLKKDAADRGQPMGGLVLELIHAHLHKCTNAQ